MPSLRSGLVVLLAGALLASFPALSRATNSPALATPVASSSERPPEAALLVAAIGDSLTDKSVGGGRYLQTLSRACPDGRFDAYGVGGQQTRHMLWRIKQDLFGGQRGAPPKPKYSHLIVLAGINDLMGSKQYVPDLKVIQKNFLEMYRIAHQHGLHVIALTVPPWGGDQAPAAQLKATDALNAWLLARPAAGDVEHAVDIRPVLSCGHPQELCPTLRHLPADRVHWNEQGHQLVGDLLKREVFASCR